MFSYIVLHQYELLEVIIQTRVTVVGSAYKKARQIHHLLSQVFSEILTSYRIYWQVIARSPSDVLRWSWQLFCFSRQPWLVWAWLLRTIVVEFRTIVDWNMCEYRHRRRVPWYQLHIRSTGLKCGYPFAMPCLVWVTWSQILFPAPRYMELL